MEERRFLLVVIGSAVVVLGGIVGGILLLKKPPQVVGNAPTVQTVAPAPAPKPAPVAVSPVPARPVEKPKPVAMTKPARPVTIPKPSEPRLTEAKQTLGVSKATMVNTVSALHLYDGEVVKLAAKIEDASVSWDRPLHSVLIPHGEPDDLTWVVFTFLFCDKDCGEVGERARHVGYGLVAIKRIIEKTCPQDHLAVNEWVTKTISELTPGETHEKNVQGINTELRIRVQRPQNNLPSWWLYVMPVSEAVKMDKREAHDDQSR